MANPGALTHYRFTDHAREEMHRRHISEEEVRQVLTLPGQVLTVRKGRKVYQAILETSSAGKNYLLRVFVDIDRDPPEVVTVYRTSRVAKYWKVGNESDL